MKTKKDIKKVHSEVYWNRDFKSLQVQKFKNIVIDNGSSDLYINTRAFQILLRKENHIFF